MTSDRVLARRRTKKEIFDALIDVVKTAPEALTDNNVLSPEQAQAVSLKLGLLASTITGREDVLRTGKGLNRQAIAGGQRNFYEFIDTDIRGCGAHIVTECFLWAQKIALENPKLQIHWQSTQNELEAAKEQALRGKVHDLDAYKENPSSHLPTNDVERAIWAKWRAWQVWQGTGCAQSKGDAWTKALKKAGFEGAVLENLQRKGVEKCNGEVEKYYNHLTGLDDE